MSSHPRAARKICWLLAAGIALVACRHAAAPEHERNQAKRVSASAEKPPSDAEPNALALASTPGKTALDRRIDAQVRALRRNPARDDGWILLGRDWVRKARESSDPGFYLNADACASALLSSQPTHPAALDLRGLVLLNQHRFAAAKALAEASLHDDPQNPLAWGTLSDAELELGQFDAAVQAVERMLQQKPGLPAYSRASYLRWLRGDHAAAVAAIRLAIDAGLDPSDREPLAWVLVQAAMLFWHEGDYAGASAGFQQALAVSKDYPPALVGVGRVALAQADAARAVQALELAFHESPLVETAWLLGDAHTLAGERAAAERAFASAEREGLRSDRRTLSLLDSTRNLNPERALRLAREEMAVRGDIYSEDALAWALYRNGQLGQARQHIEHACRLGTLDARLLYHRGAILLANGDAARGRQLIEQALRKNPKFDVTAAAEAERLLHGGRP
jgi:tetratricopeptide (TPR) repeat protein